MERSLWKREGWIKRKLGETHSEASHLFPVKSNHCLFSIKIIILGAWVAQSVQCLPLDRVMVQDPGMEPGIRLLAQEGVCFSLSCPFPCSCSPSLFLSNKIFKKKISISMPLLEQLPSSLPSRLTFAYVNHTLPSKHTSNAISSKIPHFKSDLPLSSIRPNLQS